MSQDSFGSRIKRAVYRTPIAPVDMLVSRSSKQVYYGVSEGFKSKRQYVCPLCTQGVFHLTTSADKKEGQLAVWTCETCGHEVTTKESSSKQLSQYLESEGAFLHAAGEEQGINFLTDDERRKGVAKYLFKAKVSLGISLVLLFLAPISYINGSLLTLFNTLLACTFFSIQFLHGGFSAFKVHNQLFYLDAKEHKQLVKTWLKAGNYLAVWDYPAK